MTRAEVKLIVDQSVSLLSWGSPEPSIGQAIKPVPQELDTRPIHDARFNRSRKSAEGGAVPNGSTP